MGSGKTYVGKRLARALGLPFVDLDDLIVTRTGKPITDLFADEGEPYFRELEANILREVGELPSCVVATGGGAPCHHDGMDYMLSRGMTVFLDASVEVLLERLRPERGGRPLIAGADDLRESIETRLAHRLPCYRRAHLSVTITDPETDVVRLLLTQMTAITGH